MTFPTIPTSGAGRILRTGNITPSTTVTFPNLSSLTKNDGDLLIAICLLYQSTATAGAVFSSWGGGFTEFGDDSTSSTLAVGMAYKWSDGTETGTFSASIAATVTGDADCFVMSIPWAHQQSPPEYGGVARAVNAAANPTALAPSWGAEDTLWIAVGGSGETSTAGAFTAPSVAPTNYGDLFSPGITSDAVGGLGFAVAFRQVNTASEDVGTFTVDTSNTRGIALTIAVRTAGDTPPIGLRPQSPASVRRLPFQPQPFVAARHYHTYNPAADTTIRITVPTGLLNIGYNAPSDRVTFTQADGPLDSNWTAWTIGDTMPQTVSDVVTTLAPGDLYGAFWNQDLPTIPEAQFIQMDLTSLGGGTTSMFRLFINASDDRRDSYFFEFNRASSGTWILGEYTAGSMSSSGNSPHSDTGTFKLYIQNGFLRIDVNGVQQVDSYPISGTKIGGRIGFEIYAESFTTAVDNFVYPVLTNPAPVIDVPPLPQQVDHHQANRLATWIRPPHPSYWNPSSQRRHKTKDPYVLDDFDRGTTELGYNWRAASGLGAGALTIVSNHVESFSTRFDAALWRSNEFGSLPLYASLDVTAGGGDGIAGIMLFSSPQGSIGPADLDNCYWALWWVNGGVGSYRVWRNLNGVQDPGSFAAAPTSGTVHLDVVADGTSIRLFANGTEVLNRVDSTFTSGANGMVVNTISGASPWKVDNFFAGPITADIPNLSYDHPFRRGDVFRRLRYTEQEAVYGWMHRRPAGGLIPSAVEAGFPLIPTVDENKRRSVRYRIALRPPDPATWVSVHQKYHRYDDLLFQGAAPQTITVPTGDLVLDGVAPTIAGTGTSTIAIPTGSITLDGVAPIVSTAYDPPLLVDQNGRRSRLAVAVRRPPAQPLLQLRRMDVNLIAFPQIILLPNGDLTLAGIALVVTPTGTATILVPPAVLTIDGVAPDVSVGVDPLLYIDINRRRWLLAAAGRRGPPWQRPSRTRSTQAVQIAAQTLTVPVASLRLNDPDLTLRPADNVTNGNLWTLSNGTLANSFNLVDDDPDLPDDSDFIAYSNTGSGQAWISELSAPPSSFVSADTAAGGVNVNIRYQIAGYTTGTFRLRVRLLDSTDTAITNTVTVDQNQNIGPTTGEVTLTLNANGLSKNTLADWATHRLRIDADTSIGSATLTVYAVEVNLYSPVITGVVPVVTTGSTTIATPAGTITLDGVAPDVAVGTDPNLYDDHARRISLDVASRPGPLSRAFWQKLRRGAILGEAQTIPEPTGDLALAGVAPVVSGTGTATIAIPPASLTLTGVAPVVTSTGAATITVPTGSITLTGVAPTVTGSSSATILAPVGLITIDGVVPVVSLGMDPALYVDVNRRRSTIAVAVRRLPVRFWVRLRRLDPNLIAYPQTIPVPTGDLAVTGVAPVVTATGTATIPAPVGALTIAGVAPSTTGTSSATILAPVGPITLTGVEPTIFAGDDPVLLADANASYRQVVSRMAWRAPDASAPWKAMLRKRRSDRQGGLLSSAVAAGIPLVPNFSWRRQMAVRLVAARRDVNTAAQRFMAQRFHSAPPAPEAQTIPIPPGDLTLTGVAPVVVGTGNGTILAPTGDLTLIGQAPTTAATGTVAILAPSGSVTISGRAPTVAATGTRTILVPTGDLSFTGVAPVITASTRITIPPATLSTSGVAPIVTATGSAHIAAPTGSLTISGVSPFVSSTGGFNIQIPTGQLTLDGVDPIITGGEGTTPIPTAALTLTGVAPIVTATGATTVLLPSGQATISGVAPSVSGTGVATSIPVPTGDITLDGVAPAVLFRGTVSLDVLVPTSDLAVLVPTLVLDVETPTADLDVDATIVTLSVLAPTVDLTQSAD